MRIDTLEKRIEEIREGLILNTIERAKWDETIVELTKLAEVVQSKIAQGLICYLQGIIALLSRNTKNLFISASRLHEIAKETNDPFMLISANNQLGIYNNDLCNYLTSYDYQLKALSILKQEKDKLPLKYVESKSRLLTINLTASLSAIGEDKLVVQRLTPVVNEMQCNENSTEKEVLDYLMTALNIVSALYHLKEYESAELMLQKCDSVYANIKGAKESSTYAGYIAFKYLIAANMNYETDELLKEISENNFEKIDFVGSVELMEYFLASKQYDYFVKLKNVIQAQGEEMEMAIIQINAWEGQRQYCDDIGDEKGSNEAWAKLGQLYGKVNEENHNAQAMGLVTYLEITKKLENQKELEADRNLLLKKSEYDELTGLPNRYKLMEFCKEQFKTAIENQLPLSVSIIDVDFFKQVNDNYGHLEGDNCLKNIANALQQSVKNPQKELVARYGGDEFIAIREGLADDEVILSMECLKKAVMNLAMPNKYSTVAEVITVSQGAVNQIPQKDDTLNTFLVNADKGLYEAKKKKKNTVILCKD